MAISIYESLRPTFNQAVLKKLEWESLGVRSEIKHELVGNTYRVTVTPNQDDVKQFKEKVKLA